jgi:hypothetical protein
MRATTIALFLSLTAAAIGQPGVEITVPPSSRRTGGFPFENSCQGHQTFQVTSQPHVEWLRFDPSSVEVHAYSSFAVQVTVTTAGNLPLGRYHSSVTVICDTCAASLPPCLQPAAVTPISLTVADIKAPGEFLPVTPTLPEAAPGGRRRPVPELAFVMPPVEHQAKVAVLAFCFLLVGAMGTAVALRGLTTRKRIRRFADDEPVESDRHQIRR